MYVLNRHIYCEDCAPAMPHSKIPWQGESECENCGAYIKEGYEEDPSRETNEDL